MYQAYVPDCKRYVVYYHANCSDGAASAAIAFIGLARMGVGMESVKAFPMNYTSDERRAIPNTQEGQYETNADKETGVFFLDICPSPEDIMRVAHMSRRVVVLDHHATAYDMVASLPNPLPDRTTVVVDTSGKRSGALLTAMFFLGLETPSDFNDRDEAVILRFADLISKYDTWQKPIDIQARCATNLVKRLITDYPKDYVGKVVELLNGGMELFLVHLKQEEFLYEVTLREAEAIARLAREVTFDGVPAFLVNCQSNKASLVGEAIYEKSPNHLALMYSVGYSMEDGCFMAYVSVRSKVGGPSARSVAERFKGGGHENAAGFKMPMMTFAELVSGPPN